MQPLDDRGLIEHNSAPELLDAVAQWCREYTRWREECGLDFIEGYPVESWAGQVPRERRAAALLRRRQPRPWTRRGRAGLEAAPVGGAVAAGRVRGGAVTEGTEVDANTAPAGPGRAVAGTGQRSSPGRKTLRRRRASVPVITFSHFQMMTKTSQITKISLILQSSDADVT